MMLGGVCKRPCRGCEGYTKKKSREFSSRAAAEQAMAAKPDYEEVKQDFVGRNWITEEDAPTCLILDAGPIEYWRICFGIGLKCGDLMCFIRKVIRPLVSATRCRRGSHGNASTRIFADVTC